MKRRRQPRIRLKLGLGRLIIRRLEFDPMGRFWPLMYGLGTYL